MLPQRFWDKVRKTDSCWVWIGSVTAYGYPKFRTYQHVDAAYRVLWADLNGPIPDGMQLDHLCHSRDSACMEGPNCPHRRCVNPEHLELVDGATNVRRAHKGNPDFCKNGHPRTPENTRVRPRGNGAPARDCRICVSEGQQRRRAARV
jgi:hypothetical protein